MPDDGPSGTTNDAALPDGSYDVFVIDATVDDDGADDSSTRTVHLDLTIISGQHKGQILTVSARGLAGEDFELMGMPGTLTVAGGKPAVTIDA